MGAARKKEIYNICVEFGEWFSTCVSWRAEHYIDIIIVEDDPYFFLQEGPYSPRSQRQTHEVTSEGGEEEYIASLAPSFVKYAIFLFPNDSKADNLCSGLTTRAE